jgi:uncharacterized membrane protein
MNSDKEEKANKSIAMDGRGATRSADEMHSNMEMSMEKRMQMMHMHHRQTLWVYWMIVILGCWTILNPLTFDYGISIVQPGGGRQLWLSDSQRIQYSMWSDLVAGSLLVIFGIRSLVPNRPFSLWITCFTGVWLTIAPIVFWAPTAAVYLDDTLIGMLVIALSVLIPGMPNMMMYMKMGAERPVGWSYNPSSWPQRWIMIVLGFLGLVVSRYLAAFQMGYLTGVVDPLFGRSSEHVLNSSMSLSLPISDAGVGAVAYTFEFLMGFMGSPSRWRTMPWMVALFGILVIPLGFVHIFLVVSQPITVGAWCFFCIVAACIMLPMIPLEVDEVVAMIQHTIQSVKNGERFWNVFWKGGQPMEETPGKQGPDLMNLNSQFKKVFKASLWGMSSPVNLLISLVLGLFLVVFPGIIQQDIQSFFSDVNHLCGSLIIVIAVTSFAEVVRPLRFLNVPVGLAVAILPWFTQAVSLQFQVIDLVCGISICLLSFRKGLIKESYGSWNKYIV